MSDFKDESKAERGRVFRDAWILGVMRHYPGEPKVGYIAPWEETPDWERESAAAVYCCCGARSNSAWRPGWRASLIVSACEASGTQDVR